VLVSRTVAGVLGYISSEPVRVGVDLSAEDAGEIVEFACGALQVQLGGSVISEVSGDVNAFSKGRTVSFAVDGEKRQALRSLQGSPEDVLEAMIAESGPVEVGAQGIIQGKGDELEIKG
jgi:hypothetical protein